MEAAALFALMGLGYVVTRLSGSKEEEGFQDSLPAPLTTPQGSSATGLPSVLDQQFTTLTGLGPYRSEPNPGLQGTQLTTPPPQPEYVKEAARVEAGLARATAARAWGPESAPAPAPQPIASATPDVALNPAGLEAAPTYVDGDFVVSELTGQRMKSSDFTHANMQPFFGGSVKQNVDKQANGSILDSYTGSGSLQLKKREVEQMFDTSRAPYGNPYGLESSTDFVQSRINDPRSRAGERPFEPVRVAPGVNEGFAAAGKGGFQQIEVNDYMMGAMRKTDDLRTADNPKLTYKQPVVPGQHFIGTAAQDAGEVRKYRPDKFYIDETGERFFVTTGDVIKETSRPVQMMKYTTRTDTTSEFIGPAGAQEAGQSYVTGSYRLPQTQQFGGAGYRNADMTGYYTNNPDAPEADYGRGAIEIRPNERSLTGERTMGLNLKPAEAGAVTIHYDDANRPTRRQETVGTIRQTGTPVGYAGGAPAITVWDPNDVARTTVREGTIKWDYMGIAASASQPNKLKVYDPDDIAKPTQKEQLSAKSDYFGAPNARNKDFTSHDAAYNMRLNPNKQQIAQGRDPMHGNGGALAVFDGQIHQTTRRLDADVVNDRANAVNRVVSLPTGAADIGQVRPRVPLDLDVSQVRNQREILSGVITNPLMATQDLFRNADHDETLYQEMLAAM
jgi:hypothetical protein